MFEPRMEGWTGEGFRARPRLQIPLSQFEVFCELVAATVVIAATLYLLVVWPSLPSRIPLHFDFAGRVDRWGDRNGLIPIVGVMLGIYTGLSILQRFPHIYNYPFDLTPRNVHDQYRLARQLILVLKTEIVCLFSFLLWQSVQIATGAAEGLGEFALPILLILILGTVAYHVVQSYKAR